MPVGKPRLYVALHARGQGVKMPGKEDTYHWALIVGPKKIRKGCKGMRFHAKNIVNSDGKVEWIYEGEETTMDRANSMLVRVAIGKVKDLERFNDICSKIPVSQTDPTFNCVYWVKAAMAALAEDEAVMGTARMDWQTVRDEAVTYCKRKVAEGRFDFGKGHDMVAVSTYDLLADKEIIV